MFGKILSLIRHVPPRRGQDTRLQRVCLARPPWPRYWWHCGTFGGPTAPHELAHFLLSTLHCTGRKRQVPRTALYGQLTTLPWHESNPTADEERDMYEHMDSTPHQLGSNETLLLTIKETCTNSFTEHCTKQGRIRLRN